MTESTRERAERRNWHSIVGPNGMCECGVYEGKVVTCRGLLEQEIAAALDAPRGDAVEVVHRVATAIDDERRRWYAAIEGHFGVPVRTLEGLAPEVAVRHCDAPRGESEPDRAECGRCGHTAFWHANFGRGDCQVREGCDCHEFKARASAARVPPEADALDGLVATAKHYLGPEWGQPDAEHHASFLLAAIHHLGGMKQDYVKLANRITELEAARVPEGEPGALQCCTVDYQNGYRAGLRAAPPAPASVGPEVIAAAHAETLRVFARVEGSTSAHDAAMQAANYMQEVLLAALRAGGEGKEPR